MKELIVTALMLLLLVATLALSELGLLPTMSLEHWDTVATIWGALLPFFLCLFLGVLTRAATNLWPAVLVLLESKAGLHEVTRAELETRAAMNDALMWQARHSAKAQRKAL